MERTRAWRLCRHCAILGFALAFAATWGSMPVAVNEKLRSRESLATVETSVVPSLQRFCIDPRTALLAQPKLSATAAGGENLARTQHQLPTLTDHVFRALTTSLRRRAASLQPATILQSQELPESSNVVSSTRFEPWTCGPAHCELSYTLDEHLSWLHAKMSHLRQGACLELSRGSMRLRLAFCP